MTRRILAALLVAIAGVGELAVAGLGGGSAASLALDSVTVTSITATHPCPGTLAATTPTTSGTSSTVRVTAPAACAGRTLAVAVTDGSAVRQGTAVAPASGSVTIALNGAYTPTTSTTVAATVTGWSLPVTWSYTPPVVPGCVVVDGAGNPAPGFTCRITKLTADVWGPTGSRSANYYAWFSATGVNGDLRIRFTVDLSTATGIPTDWRWATAAQTTQGNVTTLPGYACGEQPVLRAETQPGWGSYTRIYMTGVENRATSTSLACS